MPDQGITQVGPTIMRYGTEAQKRKYLKPILAGEHVWCQGYSEPNAGSDLASLQTTAVREGDEWVINGSKIWTSMSMDATHMYILVRTDPKAKPQEGISFLLIDMKTPGITVKPIIMADGGHEVNEVFFDNVRVPADALIGELNGGWTIARRCWLRAARHRQSAPDATASDGWRRWLAAGACWRIRPSRLIRRCGSIW
jgi:alkylation response protein AidB-like acyl-CoA dehydrogenase